MNLGLIGETETFSNCVAGCRLIPLLQRRATTMRFKQMGSLVDFRKAKSGYVYEANLSDLHRGSDGTKLHESVGHEKSSCSCMNVGVG